MLTMERPTFESLATVPILTRGQAAALTSTDLSDVTRWTKGACPAIARPRRRHWSPYSVAFSGLLEADMLGMLAEMKVPARRATALVRSMREQYGELARVENPGLVTDGTDMFLSLDNLLTRTRDRQGAFPEVLRKFLRRLVVVDGRVEEYRPDRMRFATVAPAFNGGALSLQESRIPVSALAGMLLAGEPAEVVAREYDAPLDEVKAVEADLEWAWQASAD